MAEPLCRKCGNTIDCHEDYFGRLDCLIGGGQFEPPPDEPQRTRSPLVHSAVAGGRHVHVTTYLEGGTVPIKATLLFWCAEDATECARVLSSALSVRTRDPRWVP